MKQCQKLWNEAFNALHANEYARAEKCALRALDAHDLNPIDRHFAYNVLIKLYYKLRDQRLDALEKCVFYCTEDINNIEDFIEAYRNESPVLPAIPSIKQLLIIEEKGGLIEDAIELCEYAIKLGIEDHKIAGGYPARLEKLRLKRKKV